MKILVCGGCGYIGSHLIREILRTTKHEVVIADNLQAFNGEMPHVDSGVMFEKGDVRDEGFLDHVFTTHKPDAVVHMCASIVVPESVRDPLGYYDNNVIGGIRILQAMRRHGCKYILFSSTAALFGTPSEDRFGKLVEPDDPVHPESPYGETKLVMEWMLRDVDHAHGIRSVCLRYFNACGAHPDGDIGFHEPATHLIPVVLRVPLGRSPHVNVFGSDYKTPDGTCVRDYIHIIDLSTAHIKALEYLEKGGKSDYFNLGVGKGYSVREVIEVARKVTGHPIPLVMCPRREGDPPMLVASSTKAKKILGWEAKYSLEESIKSAWNYFQKHPDLNQKQSK